MAQFAGAAREDNVILMGDWNLTPWSPVFREVLEIGGLHYQNFGLLPVSTWPSFNFLSVLKIPIDHVLFKGGLRPVSFARGPSNGSDHHSLIARFYVGPIEKEN
jgi:endonuclease/exonuclease/phosphatase (EEP) superfamily protein YafD